MRSNLNNTQKKVDTPSANASINTPQGELLINYLLDCLAEAKAEQILSLHIGDRSSIADYMVIASGRSDRHVGAIAERARTKCKELGFNNIRIEGLEVCDWVLIDCGSIIIHVFRPEVREFYNLEKIWGRDWSSLDNAS